MARILIIDDDLLVQKSLSRLFAEKGHDVISAPTLEAGMEEAQRGVDVVYLDLDLPDGDGLQAIDDLSEVDCQPEVIVITGMGSDYAAKKTMESSAWDYISKPATPTMVLDVLESALAYRKEARKALSPKQSFDSCGIIGDSAAIKRSLQDIAKAAASEAGVLIRGETGVGKELAALAIHNNSRRKNKPFIIVDCSSLTESLVESTLYGHKKGAFTGADSDRKGLVTEADGGTLFLDEVGELPLSLQKSFLRVLQEHRYRPVGSARELSSDFRLVAATNRDLDLMIEKQLFRNDLLFRLRTIEIILPPLRLRGADKKDIAAHFVSQSCDRYGISEKSISGELNKVIDSYPWPGNIREMMNVMEATVIQAGRDTVIYPKHLPAHVRLAFLENIPGTDGDKPKQDHNQVINPVKKAALPYADYKKECDRQYFQNLMSKTGNNIPEASKLSGLSVPSIYRHLSLAGISTKPEK